MKKIINRIENYRDSVQKRMGELERFCCKVHFKHRLPQFLFYCLSYLEQFIKFIPQKMVGVILVTSTLFV